MRCTLDVYSPMEGKIGFLDVDALNHITYRSLGDRPIYGQSRNARDSCLPFWMWRGVAMVNGEDGKTHVLEDGSYPIGKRSSYNSEFRNAELTAILHTTCLPLWMWKGVVMVTDDDGITHAVSKEVYDIYTWEARKKAFDLGGDSRWDS
jgi:hypothetical protein